MKIQNIKLQIFSEERKREEAAKRNPCRALLDINHTFALLVVIMLSWWSFCHHVVLMILLVSRWAFVWDGDMAMIFVMVWILVICGMWIVFSVFGGSKISMMVSSDKKGWSRIALIVVAIVATKMKLHTNLEVHIEARGWRQRVMTCWLALSNRILVSFEGRTTVGSHVPIAPHQLSQICPSLKKGISELHSLNCFIHCHISAAYLYL